MALAEREIRDFKRENHSLRHQLVTQHLHYVKRLVHRIATNFPSEVEIDELINAGVIGLIKAARRYDFARDNKFITYAVFRIKGEVLGELRSRDFLSRSSRKRVRELEHAYRKLEQKFGRNAEDCEVAKDLGVGFDEFYKIKEISNFSFISLEELRMLSDKEKNNLMNDLANNDQIEDTLTLIKRKEIQKSIVKAIGKLAEKEKLVISLYYWEELTMKEIGKTLNISESRVSQIHSQVIKRLRRNLTNENLI